MCVFPAVHTLSAAIEMDKLDANLEQQFDLNLIEAVKMNPVIYDRSHYNYKHFVRKAQTWKQIAETLGVSGKWNFLVNLFVSFAGEKTGPSPSPSPNSSQRPKGAPFRTISFVVASEIAWIYSSRAEAGSWRWRLTTTATAGDDSVVAANWLILS